MRSLWSALLFANVLLASLVPLKLNAAPVNTPLYPEMPAPAAAPADPPGLVALGRQLFFDTRLSEPRGTSCASNRISPMAHLVASKRFR